MRGLLSATPAPSAVRLIVGAHLLLLVQAVLVVGATRIIGTIPCLIVAASALAAVAALLLAIRGEPEHREEHRHGR